MGFALNNFILQSKCISGQSVLLTSHSLSECDSLCDTVGIMVFGEMICSGSPDLLRDQFGSGYRVDVKLGKDSSEEDVHAYMSTNFKDSTFVESRKDWLKYTVYGKISIILGLLTSAKSQSLIDGFNLDVTSLEDIFLSLTKNSNAGLDLTMQPQQSDIIPDKELVLNSAWTSEEEVANSTTDNATPDDDVPDAVAYRPPSV